MKREINLITEEFIFDPLAKIKPLLLSGWIGLLVVVLGWMIFSKEAEVRQTRLDLTRLKDHLGELTREESELTEFVQKNGQPGVEASFQQSIHWGEILSTIGAIVPEGAWLRNFEGGIKQGGKDQPAVKVIKMTGFAFSHAPITLLLSRLERQPLFAQIHLIYTQKGESPDDRYVHFEITGKLN